MHNMSTVILVLLLMMTRLSTAEFLHEPSMISIHSDVEYSDFGFAMGYLSKTNILVVGAPTVNLVGEVYTCNMNDANTLTKINCQEKPLKRRRGSKNEIAKDKRFFLGGSIVTYSDHFLTCAPLWTADVDSEEYRHEVPEAIGMCLFENNCTNLGSYEKYMRLKRWGYTEYKIDTTYFIGGTGWSTLADEANDLLLIVKSSLTGDINYSKLSHESFQKCDGKMIRPVFTDNFVKDENFNASNYFNFGFGITSGNFVSANKTVYAINMETKDMRGIVKFLEYNSSRSSVKLHLTETEILKLPIGTEAVGTKFGSVLAATDLTRDDDGLDELIVAEPLYSEDDCVDCGALHIYKMDKSGIKNHLQIRGIDDFGRFGSAIATNDIDGDGIPELVVSAPYANGGLGVIYILSGYEVNQALHEKNLIKLSEMKSKQRVQNTNYRTLGFSLQFISDIDGNGCSELVAGAPGNGSAVLFKCVQAIRIKMSNEPIGEQIVREQDQNFTIKVCAEVTYPEKQRDIDAHITMKSTIVGIRASIETPEIDVNISCCNCSKNQEKFCENITVLLSREEPGDYIFYSEAKLFTDHIFISPVFNSSWVVDAPSSQLITERKISRHCGSDSGEDCKPSLSMELLWLRRKEDQFILGSSVSETVSIHVLNDGHNAYEACVWISIGGAQLQQLSKHDECRAHNGGYRFDLPKPFRRDQKRDIKLLLNMPNTNEYKQLDVKAYLYETCDNELTINDTRVLKVPYVTNANEVSIWGNNHVRQMSEKRKNDEESAIVDVQEFLITNEGRLTWKNINTVISTKKTNYTQAFNVTVGGFDCEEFHAAEKFMHKCLLDIMPNSTLKVIATIHILKTNLKPHLIDKKLIVTSEMELHLSATEVKKMSIQSILKFETELAVGQNKLLIGIIAGVIGLLILIVIATALYKSGFFERKEKRKLLIHKESFRKRSTRRNTHIQSTAEGSGLEDNDADDEENDDCFLPSETATPSKETSGDVIQVEEKALVHC